MTNGRRIGFPRNRTETLKAITISILGSSISCQNVCQEFDEVIRVDSITDEKGRRLLQVLHSTRALDSALATFIRLHGYTDPNDPTKNFDSLGSYLWVMCYGQTTTSAIRRLRKSDLRKYQARIIDERNRYIHEAGAFPANDEEILVLLGEMYECLAKVFALV